MRKIAMIFAYPLYLVFFLIECCLVPLVYIFGVVDELMEKHK